MVQNGTGLYKKLDILWECTLEQISLYALNPLFSIKVELLKIFVQHSQNIALAFFQFQSSQ